jgi:hypothetical protein
VCANAGNFGLSRFELGAGTVGGLTTLEPRMPAAIGGGIEPLGTRSQKRLAKDYVVDYNAAAIARGRAAMSYARRSSIESPCNSGGYGPNARGRTPMKLKKHVAHVLGALALTSSLAFANSARAYDLSRFSPSDDDPVERGFVVASAALWVPAFGSYGYYHQVSFDYGLEAGFRFASVEGDHNLFFVAGFSYSPQLLDPAAIGPGDRSTSLLVAYGGIRYVPTATCTPDGTGCMFVELRLGLAFESAAASSGHRGPKGDLNFMPGIGYRFRIGSSFQAGVRADISYGEEYYDYDLGWLTLGGFAGFGW